jgi:Protein of unknown function (DUF2510)
MGGESPIGGEPREQADGGREPPVEPATVAAPGFYPDPRNPGVELYWDGDKWTNESPATAPDPGFYPDPNDPKVERYWDGRKWTESRQPIGLGRAGEVDASGKAQEASGVIIAGYVFAVLMPIVGFIIGLTQINKNRHGIWVVVVAAVAFVIWLAIFSGEQSASN